jgi:hypothetical protein
MLTSTLCPPALHVPTQANSSNVYKVGTNVVIAIALQQGHCTLKDVLYKFVFKRDCTSPFFNLPLCTPSILQRNIRVCLDVWLRHHARLSVGLTLQMSAL